MPQSVDNRREGQGNGNHPPVLAQMQGFEMLDPLAPMNPFQDLSHFVMAFRQGQQGQALADALAGDVAVNLLRSPIPTDDVPVKSGANDGIIGRFNDGGQKGT